MKREDKSVIMVKVGGVEYETIYDEHGTQRFREDRFLGLLINNGLLDLNKVEVAYHEGKMGDQRCYAEFKMALGYSVSGFSELSAFEDMEIDNPVWKE